MNHMVHESMNGARMKCLPLKPEPQSLQPIVVGPDAANNLDFDLLAMYIIYLWRIAVQSGWARAQ